MSALSILVICERLCKGASVRIPAMSAAELAEFLNVLAYSFGDGIFWDSGAPPTPYFKRAVRHSETLFLFCFGFACLEVRSLPTVRYKRIFDIKRLGEGSQAPSSFSKPHLLFCGYLQLPGDRYLTHYGTSQSRFPSPALAVETGKFFCQ